MPHNPKVRTAATARITPNGKCSVERRVSDTFLIITVIDERTHFAIIDITIVTIAIVASRLQCWLLEQFIEHQEKPQWLEEEIVLRNKSLTDDH